MRITATLPYPSGSAYTTIKSIEEAISWQSVGQPSKKAVKDYLDKKGFKGQYRIEDYRLDPEDTGTFEVFAKRGTALEKVWDPDWDSSRSIDKFRKDEDALGRVVKPKGWVVGDAAEGSKLFNKRD